MSELTLEAKVENLDEVLSFVDGHLEEIGCMPKIQMQIDIAVEELFVNIAHYAYKPKTGPATVRVDVEKAPLAVTITFIDHGIPYDPLAKADPDVTLSAAEREIGGLGIFMVKKSMDDIEYEYRDGQNILKIRKTIDGGGGGGSEKKDPPEQEAGGRKPAFPVAFAILQWTWGFIQTFAGALLTVFLLLKEPKRQRVFFHGAYAVDWHLAGSMSLGAFLFLSSGLGTLRDKVMVHEYGHSLQSLILGPFYLPVIGIPSLLWTNLPAAKRKRSEKQIPITRFYTETWAGNAAEKRLKLPAYWAE